MRGALALKGRQIAEAWVPGALEYYHLSRGYPLAVAKKILREHGLRVGDPTVVENTIVDDGLELALDMLIDDVDAGCSIHAIGRDGTTPASSDTQLIDEANRKAFTTRSRTAREATFSIFYLASESSFSIEECGVFGGSAAAAGTPDSGTLFSRYLDSKDNSGGTVDLTFDYILSAQEA